MNNNDCTSPKDRKAKKDVSYLEALSKAFRPKDNIWGRFIHRSKIQRRLKR